MTAHPDTTSPRMGSRNMLIVAYTAALSMMVLHGPRPLLSSLSLEFAVDRPTASLFMTAALLPLGLAPVAYGYLLEGFSAKKLLALSLCLLCACQLALAMQRDFTAMLGFRLGQGIALPALLTSLMTYVASTNRSDTVQRVMSLYIGATIFGGVGGRILCGYLASGFGRRTAFLCLAAGLAANLLLLAPLKADNPASFSRMRLGAVREVLGTKGFKPTYFVVFCIFFVFTAVYNLLPFRLTDLEGTISEFRIGLMYSGQAMGILIALLSTRIVRILGQPPRLFPRALALYLAAVFAFLLPSVTAVFATMFPFACGMFLVHTTAPGHLNREHQANSGVVNGLYLMVYYLGGAMGAYLPVMAYRQWGWTPCVLLLASLAAAALAVAAARSRRADRLVDSTPHIP